MSGPFEYKGYFGSAEVDVDGETLVGKLLYITDTIAYSAPSIRELRAAFQEAVDDYLETCVEVGRLPEPPPVGTLKIVLGPALYGDLVRTAARCDMTLDEFVSSVLFAALVEEGQQDLSTQKVRIRNNTVTMEDLENLNRSLLNVITEPELPGVVIAYRKHLANIWAVVRGLLFGPYTFVRFTPDKKIDPPSSQPNASH
jgi:predicted HicB family RNase H-like nuclease